MKAESGYYLFLCWNEEEIVCTILSSLQQENDQTVSTVKNNISPNSSGVFHNLKGAMCKYKSENPRGFPMPVITVSTNTTFRTLYIQLSCTTIRFGPFWPTSGSFQNNMHGKEFSYHRWNMYGKGFSYSFPCYVPPLILFLACYFKKYYLNVAKKGRNMQ